MSQSDRSGQTCQLKLRIRPLAFGWSLLVTIVSLFVARELVKMIEFTGFRMFADGAIWWQVLVYFAIVVGLYVGAVVVINLIRQSRPQ